MYEKKYDDRRYISRGKFYVLHLDNTIMEQGVEQLNENKVGYPFVYSDECFMVMALFRNTIGTPYRQLQGIIEEILGKENSPNFSAIYKRINKISLEDNNGSSWFSDGKTKTEIVFLAGDSTGLKPTSRGDWMGEKWNIKRGFIKLHIMVDSKTKKIYAVSITDEKSGDAPEFEKLLSEALYNIENSTNVVPSEELLVGCDGAYDSNDNFDECEKQNVTPVIPIRKNFSVKTKGSDVRKKQGLLQLGDCKINHKNVKMFNDLTEEQKMQNKKQWKKDVGYGRRWSVEIAISTFKRVLSENISARIWCNVAREIKFKVMIYNLMIDATLEQEMNQN
ncbi:MAG: IS5 family transposase [Nitrosopumilus sp.]|nr:IS5 family transposase [Nitrosopumilus sp.]